MKKKIVNKQTAQFIYPKSAIYVLQRLHAHPSGFQFLTFILNSGRDSDSFISLGKISHIFGPRKVIVSILYFSVFKFEFPHNH